MMKVTLGISDSVVSLQPVDVLAGERQQIESVLAAHRMVLNGSDRETIQRWTRALNGATAHLAEIVMNRSVSAALSGKSIDDV